MGAWLEDLLADERFYLIKEMHELGTEHPHYSTKLAEVRMCEKLLDYVRGSMKMAGWKD
jgi:hypothetical protein